jgi:hypothetical protein
MKKDKNLEHIVHAHDRFFKKMMTDKRVAKDFFSAHLPADLYKI